MKKGIIVMVLALCSLLAFGQSEPQEFSLIMVDSAVVGTKQQIYEKIETFLSTKLDNLTLRDKESFKYVGDGHFTMPVKSMFGERLGEDRVKFKCMVQIKDNKYKLTMSNFYHEGGDYKGSRVLGEIGMTHPKGAAMYSKGYRHIREFCISEFDKFVIKLDEALTSAKSSDDF